MITASVLHVHVCLSCMFQTTHLHACTRARVCVCVREREHAHVHAHARMHAQASLRVRAYPNLTRQDARTSKLEWEVGPSETRWDKLDTPYMGIRDMLYRVCP